MRLFGPSVTLEDTNRGPWRPRRGPYVPTCRWEVTVHVRSPRKRVKSNDVSIKEYGTDPLSLPSTRWFRTSSIVSTVGGTELRHGSSDFEGRRLPQGDSYLS